MAFTQLTPEMVLEIYRMGCFPMAESADSPEFEIFEARQRSLLPFENINISRSLRKKILRHEFDIRFNTAFDVVIEACAETAMTRPESWINAPIMSAFKQLHRMGFAHSVESWKNGKLVGGLYGLQIGAAFCGESMFSRATDASKVALVHLCARLSNTGFTLLDAQLPNPHLEQFGQFLISQDDYKKRLEAALLNSPDFNDNSNTSEVIISKYLSKNTKY